MMSKAFKIFIEGNWFVSIIALGAVFGAIYGWAHHGWIGAIAHGFVGFCVGGLVAFSPDLQLDVLS